MQDSEALAKLCTDGVFKIKGSNVELVQDKVYESNLLEAYAEADKGVTLTYSDNIVFYLESWGQLTCKEILVTSAEILLEKSRRWKTHLRITWSNLRSNKLSTERIIASAR